MPNLYISKIKLPGSDNVYYIKDSEAREILSGGVQFKIAWDGTSIPVIADIPAGVTVTYNGTSYTGTLSAETTGTGTHAEPNTFYLVKSSTQTEVKDVYDEYVPVGTTGSKTWEKIGDTQIDLSDVVTNVTFNKQTDKVLGTGTTFALSSGTVTVTPTTTDIKATATGGGVDWNSKDQKTVVTGYTIAAANKDTFVKSVSAETNKKLDTTTIPNVTSAGTASTWTFEEKSIPNVTSAGTASSWTFEEKSIPNVTAAGSASTWSFEMGSGTGNEETLIISGGNSTAPTLGTAIKVQSKSGGSNSTAPTLGTAIKVQSKSGGGNGTAPTLGTAIIAATGTTSANGSGDAVVTGVTIGASADAITSLPDPSTANVIGSSATFTPTQPTVKLTSGATPVTGTTVNVATGISSASVGTGITVGTNDEVTALTDSTSITVTGGADFANGESF